MDLTTSSVIVRSFPGIFLRYTIKTKDIHPINLSIAAPFTTKAGKPNSPKKEDN
ncbi:MAG TPA: hypothetical protein PK894_04915 [Defluviitoga sp.]|nr:hypothetical protein [Defluviitoga sp.]HPZ29514.1 hypothetical protein [Defluviitoga sp.]HQD62921.1 hypothetical protein [Defluviitoga sp.]